MSSRFALAITIALASATSVFAQRQWIVYPTSYQENNWITVTGGDYDGRDYKFYYMFDGSTRAFWDLTPENCIPVAPNTDIFPVKPGMYAVEEWAPSVMPDGISSWDWSPIEVTFDGPGAGEEATQNLFIPWNGQYGTNHQWIGLELGTLQGAWKAAGPGPQAPATTACTAPGNGSQMWMKRGSTLYRKWNFGWDIVAPITALRLTEVYSDTTACSAPTAVGGAIDLRCIGNADPLYTLHEPFANDDERRQATSAIDSENALAATGYTVWVCLDPGYPFNVPLTPGLPVSGAYTAHLADRDVLFQLNYDGFNTFKWRTNETGEFATANVATLNGTPGQEFVPGNYSSLYLLTASSGGLGHRLAVKSTYADNSQETAYINLYDWMGKDGDETSVAVGVNGTRRTAGGQGFARLSRYGDSVEHGGGGDANGAFMIAHTVSVNSCKTLTRVDISTDFTQAPSYIVESRSGGINYASFSTTGVWANDSAKSNMGELTAGIGSLQAPAGQSGTTAIFSFTPTVTAYYEPQVTWAKNLDACTKAAFTVTHDGAPVTMTWNQRDGGDGWHGLGQYHLTAGQTYTVTLDAAASIEGPRVYADAVRWTTPGITANLLAATLETGICCNRPWADADGDQDVDMTDFAVFQRCLTIGLPGILPGCECMDADDDGSIDSDDYDDFNACGLGPDVDFIHDLNPPYWPNWPAACPGKPAQ